MKYDKKYKDFQMNKPINQLVLIIFIIILCSIPAYAQKTYSLFELAQLANKQSETIKIAEDDLYIAHQDKKRALSVLIPSLTAYGSMTEYKEEDVLVPNTLTTGIKLTQSFTLNGKELIALDVANSVIKGKKFILESIRSKYLLQLTQAYYNILSARSYLEIAESDLKRLQTHTNAVKEKLSVGNVTITDLYRAKAELSKSLTEQLKAKNKLMQAKAGLHNLINIEEDFDLKKEVIHSIEDYECTLKDIQSSALENRYEIKEAQKNLEIAIKTIKFNKSDYWPLISLEAGYQETESDSGSGAEKSNIEDTYFTGEFVFTLFDGGLRRAQIRQTLADHRKAENALSLQKKNIILESKTAFLNYETTKSILTSLQDELKASQENYNAVQMQFKQGMADSIDIMDANTLLVTAQRKISDANYTKYLAVLNILYTKNDLTDFILMHRKNKVFADNDL